MTGVPRRRPTVVLTQRVHDEVEALLGSRFHILANESDEPLPRTELLRRCQDADAVMVFMPDHIDAEFVERCASLRIVAGALKGHDNIDIVACTRHGVWVTVCDNLLTEPTADLALGLIVSITRNVLAGDRHVRSGAFRGWRPILYGAWLQGKTLGIIGMGAIGSAIARRATGFGLRTVYTDRVASANGDVVGTRLELHDLLAASDIVMPLVHLDHTTRRLIDASAIARMKPGSFIVNVGRGSVVCEQAIVEALADGRLAGYAADVFAMEDWAERDRPGMIHPELLADAEHTVLTPHIGSAVADVRRAIELQAAQSIIAALSGEQPPGAVNAHALQVTG